MCESAQSSLEPFGTEGCFTRSNDSESNSFTRGRAGRASPGRAFWRGLGEGLGPGRARAFRGGKGKGGNGGG